MNKRLTRRLYWLRVLGNTLTVLGYFIILHVNPLIGSTIKIVGFSLMIPSILKYKMYDVVAMASVFMILDISNIIRIIFK